MSYYGQGDYYAAGGLGSFLKKAVGTVARGALGLVTGGPMGAAAAVAPGLLSRGPAPVPMAQPQIQPITIPLPGPLRLNTPFSFEASTGPRIAFDMQSSPDGLPPRGYHLNKSAYFLRDGTFVPARSRFVRNRSRNPANGRALRRAIGRVSSFNSTVKRSRKSLKALASI